MGDSDVEVTRHGRMSDALAQMAEKALEAADPPREYRLSVRLTPAEYARIEQWQKIFQDRAKGYFTATQKTVLLEALDALDFREAERARKASSARSTRSKKQAN